MFAKVKLGKGIPTEKCSMQSLKNSKVDVRQVLSDEDVEYNLSNVELNIANEIKDSEEFSDSSEEEAVSDVDTLKEMENIELLERNEKGTSPDGDSTIKDVMEDLEDEEDAPSTSDPYTLHFNFMLPETVNKDQKLSYELKPCERPQLGHMSYAKPNLYVNDFSIPCAKQDEDLSQFHLKNNLLKCSLVPSPVQLDFLSMITDYFDVTYMQRTHSSGKALRNMWILHATNHILKSRAKVVHHNSKLSKNPDEEFRDQGFTRPTVLVLVPFRHDCFLVLKSLIALLPEAVVTNKKRFEKEYGPPPQNPKRKKKSKEYEDTFEGNIDEDFKVGLRIKNKSITLYSEFYSSDIIVASPLGLRQVIGAEGDRERDFDFLSSIEILIIDRADVLYLQNLPHLLHVLKHINLMPKDSHGCNFFRVRMYALDGLAKFFRQTILLSSVEHRWFESVLLQTFCSNYKGYLRSISTVKSKGISQIFETIKLCFRFLDYSSPQSECDDRFRFFVSHVLSDFQDAEMAQTLIYIPSYYDYVRIRNHFRSQEISAVMICEYSEPGKVAEARNNFFKGRRHFLLYTERAHFYHRYRLKGVQHILFYQPPTYPSSFKDINLFFLDSNPRRKDEPKTCTVIASRMDSLQLKHIVGMKETQRMIASKEKVFVKYVQR